jgi:hypothetical protein
MKPEVHEILKPLEYLDQPYPRDAMEQAVANRELVVPDLKKSIEWTIAEFETASGDLDYVLNLYALYLLAYFRETSFLPTVIDLCRMPEIDDFLDDQVTLMSKILASLSIDQPHLLHAIIEDPHANEYIRNGALEALTIHYFQKNLPEPEFKAYLKHLFEKGLEQEASFIWDGAVQTVCDFQFQEFEPEVRFAFENGLAHPGVMGYEEALDQLFGRKPSFFDETPLHYIDDVHGEIEWWACFHEDKEDTEHDSEDDSDDFEHTPFMPRSNEEPALLSSRPVQTPIVKTTPKIGRNEPCPCGSGLKYKKCCGKH